MYQEISQETSLHQGEIKIFLWQKGYGFINCPDFGGDVYFQRTNLPEDLQVNVTEDVFTLKGLPCYFEPLVTPDGKPQARNIKVVGGEGVRMVGMIKSYNPKNLYGFINSSMLDGDIYFNAKDLPAPLQQADLRGQKVRFVVMTMQDGKVQARDLMVLGGGAPMGHAMSMPQAMMQPMQMGMPPMAQTARVMPPGMGMGMGMGMGHVLPDGSNMVGTVKSFDPAKGFGFILAPNFPGDIYFKPDPSKAEAFSPGQEVTFLLKYAADGRPQAREVSEPLQHGESFAGVVKRYNPTKGFGFLHVEGRAQDVYFQKMHLTADVQELQLEGAQFQFTVNMMNGGRVQAQDLQLVMMPPQGIKRPAATQGMATPSFAAKRARTGPELPLMMNGTPRPSMAQQAAMSMAMGMGMPMAPMPRMAAPMATPMVRPMAPQIPTGVEAERNQGTVKSYNPLKGFGFILSPTVPGDVYFQAKNLPEPFRAVQLSHRQVTFTVRYTPDGKIQANNIQVVS